MCVELKRIFHVYFIKHLFFFIFIYIKMRSSNSNIQTDSKDSQSQYYRPWDSLKQIKEDGKVVLRLPEKTVDSLIKKQYGVFGHSAVQICSWTKKAMTGRGVCYKQKFYGIDTHSCFEMSPSAMWCQQNCTFCWRPMEFMKNVEIDPEQVDEPEEIIKKLVLQRKKLISGMGGHENVNRMLFNDSFLNYPTHYAISLSGEPTMYPKLPEMVEYLKTLSRTKSIFIVTNAQEPNFFQRLIDNPIYQPTQIYISLDAHNKELFDKVNISLYKNGWDRLKTSLKLMSKLNCRTVIRYTMIKGLNDLDSQLNDYKSLIESANPDLIEIKAYMHLGMSRNRHSKEQMPEYLEVEEFAKKLENLMRNYEFAASAPNSKICVLRRVDSKHPLRIKEFENQKFLNK